MGFVHAGRVLGFACRWEAWCWGSSRRLWALQGWCSFFLGLSCATYLLVSGSVQKAGCSLAEELLPDVPCVRAQHSWQGSLSNLQCCD